MKPIALRIDKSRVVLYPLSCIHWPIGEKDLLKKWVEEVRKEPDALVLLLGDSFDAARTHFRKHIKGYVEDANSQESLDGWARQEIRELAEILKPIKGKILGSILGNHFWEFLDGTNSEQYLCQLLGTKYLGPTAVVRLSLPSAQRTKTRKNVVLYAHHHGGAKGGRSTGGDLSALTRAEESFEADVYCLGHTHRCYGFKNDKLRVSSKGEPKLVALTRVFLRCGTLLKGYREDNPTVDKPHRAPYAEENAYRPTTLGWLKCEINVVERHVGKGVSKNGKPSTRSVSETLYKVSY